MVVGLGVISIVTRQSSFFYEALEVIKIEHVAVLENLADASESFDYICNA